MFRIDGNERWFAAFSVLGGIAGVAFVLWLGHGRNDWIEAQGMLIGVVVMFGCVATMFFLARRASRMHDEATKLIQKVFSHTVSRLFAIGMPTKQWNFAARPESVGHIQLTTEDTGYSICDHNELVPSVRLRQVVESNGVLMRNDLGVACFICGAYRENPEASFAGTLAPALLNRTNLLEVIAELEAKGGITQDAATDGILARREQELKSELGKIQAKRQAFAFASGQPLEPAEPYRKQ